jgi:Ca-activated chloride channel homolog
MLVLVACAAGLSAQTSVLDLSKLPPPPEDPNAFKLSSDVELVLLDISVKKQSGGFATGLEQKDFKVFENGREQPITSFAAGDIPVTVGLVIDNSASVRAKRPEIVTAALAFVQNSNPHDEVFIVNFNDSVMMGLKPDVPFTDNHNILREALLTNPAQGRTALYDGIKAALEHLKHGRQDKKTLIVISDGGDNASDTTEREILDMALVSTATIYTIGIYDPEARDKNPGFLKDLAKTTGGEAYTPHGDSMELVASCKKIAEDVRNRYTVGFAPGDTRMDGKPRRLRVMAAAPPGEKFKVRTRTQYLLTPKTSRSRHQ